MRFFTFVCIVEQGKLEDVLFKPVDSLVSALLP
jgi:hypothetical protein